MDQQQGQQPPQAPPSQPAQPAQPAQSGQTNQGAQIPVTPPPPVPAPEPFRAQEPARFVSNEGPKLPKVSLKFAAGAVIVVTVLTGAFYYFRTIKKAVERQQASTSRLITQIELETEYTNPFEKEAQYVNPFSEYKSQFARIQ